ncbi:MAG: hypothetical protein H5U40_07650, partial [Polyangiaceae bacterium]|nr:hypothetical protein [Polyangiaceae bacterium]
GSLGKSGQLPFSGWLPRAMEGPTTSSAIFYGALSVHAGPYLLLRTAPLWEPSRVVAACVVLVGAASALHATFVGRVQTDAKSALAYATLAQVGLVFVEIGLGFRTLALVHIVGNALLRSLQLLRAPSAISDHELVENGLGRAIPRSGGQYEAMLPAGARRWLYRLALERGDLDALVVRAGLAGQRFLALLDRFDRNVIDAIGGHHGGASVEESPKEPSKGVAR